MVLTNKDLFVLAANDVCLQTADTFQLRKASVYLKNVAAINKFVVSSGLALEAVPVRAGKYDGYFSLGKESDARKLIIEVKTFNFSNGAKNFLEVPNPYIEKLVGVCGTF